MTDEGKLRSAITEMVNVAPVGALLFIYGFLLEYVR